jgi:hypothetical protein
MTDSVDGGSGEDRLDERSYSTLRSFRIDGLHRCVISISIVLRGVWPDTRRLFRFVCSEVQDADTPGAQTQALQDVVRHAVQVRDVLIAGHGHFGGGRGACARTRARVVECFGDCSRRSPPFMQGADQARMDGQVAAIALHLNCIPQEPPPRLADSNVAEMQHPKVTLNI